MTAAEFCALPDDAKRRHVATLTSAQRHALVNAVAAHHQGVDADPFRLRQNRQFREWAAKRSKAD